MATDRSRDTPSQPDFAKLAEELEIYANESGGGRVEETLRSAAYAIRRIPIEREDRVIVQLSIEELQTLIEYHNNQESGADAMGLYEPAKYHAELSKHYADLLSSITIYG